MTHSGILVEPGNGNIPTLRDAAIGMGRQPRFGGQTRRWWPVLLHALVCERIAFQMQKPVRMRLIALLHDAHEAVTADVPTTWKPAELKFNQGILDRGIYRAAGIGTVSIEEHLTMKGIDAAALRAEGVVVGPPHFGHHYGVPVGADVEIVRNIAAIFPKPEDTDGLNSYAVSHFLWLAGTLARTRAIRVA